MNEPRPRQLALGPLIAGALLLTAAVVVITLVPLRDCKACRIRVAYEEALRLDSQVVVVNGQVVKEFNPPPVNNSPPPQPGCADCNRGRLTLLKMWLGPRR